MKPDSRFKPKSPIAALRLSYAASLRLALGLSATTLSLQSAHADATWVGDISEDWNNAANWSTDPANPGGVLFANGAGTTPVISANSAWTNSDIKVGSSGTGRLDHSAGAAATGSGNWFFVGSNGGTGTYNLANTGTVNASGISGYAQGNGSLTAGKLWVGGADYNDNGTGTVNINTSGTLATTDTGGGGVILGGGWNGGTGNATVNLEGGTVNVASQTWVGRAGTAVWNQSGGTLNSASYLVIGRESGGANNYTVGNGTINLTGGTINAATTSGFAVMASFSGSQGALNVSGGTFNSTAGGIIIGESGTGTLTVSGSGLVNIGTNGYYTGANAGGTGTITLNGGTLQGGNVSKGGGSATFNFNGGTLKATVNTTTFMQGLTAAKVQADGAVIDSNGFNITVGQALIDDGGGSLTKIGTGTLTLTGANTYTGATQVNGGTLVLNGTATSNVVVGNSGTFGGTGSTTGSATFNAGGSLQVDLSGSAFTANGITFSGTNPVIFTGGTLDQGLTYDVFLTSGGAITGVANLVATSRGTFNSEPGKITFTAGGTGTRTWNTTSGNWEINGATTNWVEGDKKFLNGDTVIFNNPAAASTVTLVGSLLPASITVTNTTNPYTFGGSGSLAGTTTLTKGGSGSLTLATANNHSGDTTLEAGTLNLANAAALGTGMLVINGGTLDNTSGSSLALANNIPQAWNGNVTFTGTHGLDMGSGAVTVGGDGTDRTVTVNANTLTVGEISSPSLGLIKQGAGTLEVTNVGININSSIVAGGPMNVAAGTVQINRTGVNADNSGDFTAAGLTGSGAVTNGAAVERWFFTNPAEGSFTFSGSLTNGNTGALGFNKSGNGTQVIAGANSYTGWTTVNGGELVISGANNGAGSYTEVVTGKLTLANNQSLGTDTLIRFFGVDVSTLDLAMDTDGTAYSITKGTGTNIAIVSNRATPGAGINHTLTTQTGNNGIGGGTINITSGANVTSGSGRVTFTQFGLGAGSVQTTMLNPTTANVTLGNVAKQNNNVSQTLGLGGTSTDNQVTGAIANGTPLTGDNNVSVLKTGTSTWTLAGANTYTGTTTVNDGILSIAQAVLADTAAVHVASPGVLNLTHGATDTVDRFFIDGVEQAAGTWGSLSSSATHKTARITGSGILQATNGAATGGFNSWATALGLTAGTNDGAAQNPDNDGFENGTEYLLGGHPLSGSNNPKVYPLIADSSADGDNTKELIMTIAVPQGTPAFPAGSPASSVIFEGFGITVRGSTDLATFPVTVTPVTPVTTGLPSAPFVQGGITYEYRSFSLGGSNGTTGKGFLQVTVTNP